jgi:hypothetical protein
VQYIHKADRFWIGVLKRPRSHVTDTGVIEEGLEIAPE